ncbi:hypothetical protein MHBO_000253 [Bonamia ostreae]|uniref:Zinc finger PHD-type domain-containing protein n=1 Tax=Bonamia ostreae TaxID=126728 RepID=A0ABV2AEY3_9EUKA
MAENPNDKNPELSFSPNLTQKSDIAPNSKASLIKSTSENLPQKTAAEKSSEQRKKIEQNSKIAQKIAPKIAPKIQNLLKQDEMTQNTKNLKIAKFETSENLKIQNNTTPKNNKTENKFIFSPGSHFALTANQNLKQKIFPPNQKIFNVHPLSHGAFQRAAASVGPRLAKSKYFPTMGAHNQENPQNTNFPQNTLNLGHSLKTQFNHNLKNQPDAVHSAARQNPPFAPKSAQQRPPSKLHFQPTPVSGRDFSFGLDAASFLADKVAKSHRGKKALEPEKASALDKVLFYGPDHASKMRAPEKERKWVDLLAAQLSEQQRWREEEWKRHQHQIYLARNRNTLRLQRMHLARASQEAIRNRLKSHFPSQNANFRMRTFFRPSEYGQSRMAGSPLRPPNFGNAPLRRNFLDEQRVFGNLPLRRVCIRCRSSMHQTKLLPCSMCSRAIHSFCVPGGVPSSERRMAWICSQKCKNKANAVRRRDRNNKPRKVLCWIFLLFCCKKEQKF